MLSQKRQGGLLCKSVIFACVGMRCTTIAADDVIRKPLNKIHFVFNPEYNNIKEKHNYQWSGEIFTEHTFLFF